MVAKKGTPAKKKQPAAIETSESIAEQTRAFFKAGGKVERIANGISGQNGHSGPRHISLGNKK